MQHNPKAFRNGELAYDILQDSPVVVTDVATSRVGDLDSSTRDKVLDAHGNQLLDVDDVSPTVEVAFPGLTSPATTGYTYPQERLIVPDVTEVTDGLTPAQLAQAALFRDLMREASMTNVMDDLKRLAMNAGVDTAVVEYADEYDK